MIRLTSEQWERIRKHFPEEHIPDGRPVYAFGRPIAAFQAIKHKLADVYVAIELARSNAYYGAWAITAGAEELPVAGAAARVAATDAFHLASKENIQTHGGIGFTWEADCHFYYRRSKTLKRARLCLVSMDVSSFMREGDKFDYYRWLEQVRGEAAQAKELPQPITSGNNVTAKIDTPNSILDCRKASPNRTLFTRRVPIPGGMRRSHHEPGGKTAKARLRRRLEKIRDVWDDFQANRCP